MTRLISSFIVGLGLLIILQSPVPVLASIGFGTQQNEGISDTFLVSGPSNLPSDLSSELMATPPAYIPLASTDEIALNFDDGQTLTTQDFDAAFGYAPQISQTQGIEVYPYPLSRIPLWVYYKSKWTQSNAGTTLDNTLPLAFYVNQRQRITVWEYYKNEGKFIKKDFGYRGPGYVYIKFIGDTLGWHYIMLQGEQSWSNMLRIYVDYDYAWYCFTDCISTKTVYNPDLNLAIYLLKGTCSGLCKQCLFGTADCRLCAGCVSYYTGIRTGMLLGELGWCAWECNRNRPRPIEYNYENDNKQIDNCPSCLG